MDRLKNIVLKIAYDGTAYKGWQNTKTLPTIESALEKALTQLLLVPPKLQAASRTDAGVHAQGQIVNFFSDTKLPLKGLKSRLNNLLPKDISVLDVFYAPFDFHPSLNAISKEYHYFVCNSSVQMPEKRLYSWHFPYPLDFELMKEAAQILTGHLNFEAFCNHKGNQNYQDYLREVSSIEITPLEHERIQFSVKGQKFLYKMVRNLVGTLLYVGSKKLSLEDLKEAVKSKDRRKIGVTAKAHGLSLYEIHYV